MIDEYHHEYETSLNKGKTIAINIQVKIVKIYLHTGYFFLGK